MPQDTKKKSKRGLASADPQTRKRVASMGGSSHDTVFFSQIGRKGGRARGKKNSKSSSGGNTNSGGGNVLDDIKDLI